jgi:hypothetical protein
MTETRALIAVCVDPFDGITASGKTKQHFARLLAAAPELLHACEMALVCIADNPEFWAEERELRAAIHKAKGE